MSQIVTPIGNKEISLVGGGKISCKDANMLGGILGGMAGGFFCIILAVKQLQDYNSLVRRQALPHEQLQPIWGCFPVGATVGYVVADYLLPCNTSDVR